MAGVGIFLILMGYTLVYAGIKDISAMGELSYGLGIGPDPFVTNEIETKETVKTQKEEGDFFPERKDDNWWERIWNFDIPGLPSIK